LWHISRILLRKNLRWGQCMFICPPDQTWRTINWMSSRYQLSNCPCIRMPMHQTNKYQNCNIQWGYLVCNVGKWRRDIYIDMYILWIYTYVIICVYIYIYRLANIHHYCYMSSDPSHKQKNADICTNTCIHK
jgi:hypothetical protein